MAEETQSYFLSNPFPLTTVAEMNRFNEATEYLREFLRVRANSNLGVEAVELVDLLRTITASLDNLKRLVELYPLASLDPRGLPLHESIIFSAAAVVSLADHYDRVITTNADGSDRSDCLTARVGAYIAALPVSTAEERRLCENVRAYLRVWVRHVERQMRNVRVNLPHKAQQLRADIRTYYGPTGAASEVAIDQAIEPALHNLPANLPERVSALDQQVEISVQEVRHTESQRQMATADEPSCSSMVPPIANGGSAENTGLSESSFSPTYEPASPAAETAKLNLDLTVVEQLSKDPVVTVAAAAEVATDKVDDDANSDRGQSGSLDLKSEVALSRSTTMEQTGCIAYFDGPSDEEEYDPAEIPSGPTETYYPISQQNPENCDNTPSSLNTPVSFDRRKPLADPTQAPILRQFITLAEREECTGPLHGRLYPPNWLGFADYRYISRIPKVVPVPFLILPRGAEWITKPPPKDHNLYRLYLLVIECTVNLIRAYQTTNDRLNYATWSAIAMDILIACFVLSIRIFVAPIQLI